VELKKSQFTKGGEKIRGQQPHTKYLFESIDKERGKTVADDESFISIMHCRVRMP